MSSISLVKSDFEIDTKSLKIYFDPLLENLKNCIKNNTDFYAHNAKTLNKFNLIEKLEFNKFTKRYYAPDNLFFYPFNRSTEHVDHSLYSKKEKFFFPKDLLKLIQKHEIKIKESNYPNINYNLKLRKICKNIPKELFELNEKTDVNKTLQVLFDNYDVQIIQNFPKESLLLFFEFYLMSLCKELAIINRAYYYINSVSETNLSDCITTKFPKNKKYIAIFFGNVHDQKSNHSNLLFIDRKKYTIYHYDSSGGASKNKRVVTDDSQRMPEHWFKNQSPPQKSITLKVYEFIKFVLEDFKKRDNKKYTIVKNNTKYQFAPFICEYFSHYELTKILIEKNLIGKEILPPLRGILKNKFNNPQNAQFLKAFKKLITKAVFENPVIISKIHHLYCEKQDKSLFIKNYPSIENI
jgi:hypothetical protein